MSGDDLRALLTELVNQTCGDPKLECQIEAEKMRMQAVGAQVLVSSGMIAAIGGVASLISEPQSTWLLYLAIISLASSVVAAFGYMQRTASNVERPEGAKPRLANRYRGTSLVGFVMGLVAFLVFLDLSL